MQDVYEALCLAIEEDRSTRIRPRVDPHAENISKRVYAIATGALGMGEASQSREWCEEAMRQQEAGEYVLVFMLCPFNGAEPGEVVATVPNMASMMVSEGLAEPATDEQVAAHREQRGVLHKLRSYMDGAAQRATFQRHLRVASLTHAADIECKAVSHA